MVVLVFMSIPILGVCTIIVLTSENNTFFQQSERSMRRKQTNTHAPKKDDIKDTKERSVWNTGKLVQIIYSCAVDHSSQWTFMPLLVKHARYARFYLQRYWIYFLQFSHRLCLKFVMIIVHILIKTQTTSIISVGSYNSASDAKDFFFFFFLLFT